MNHTKLFEKYYKEKNSIDTWEKAKNFIKELDSNPELLADFNLQMRRRKLDKIKNKNT